MPYILHTSSSYNLERALFHNLDRDTRCNRGEIGRPPRPAFSRTNSERRRASQRTAASATLLMLRSRTSPSSVARTCTTGTAVPLRVAVKKS